MKKKVVKESLNENIRFNGHTFERIDLNGHSIYVGEDGILGDNEILIPWAFIEDLLHQYHNKYK